MQLVKTNTWPQLAKDLQKHRHVKMYISTAMRKQVRDIPSTLSWLNTHLPRLFSNPNEIITVLSVETENVNGVRKIGIVMSLSNVSTNEEALFLLQKGESLK